MTDGETRDELRDRLSRLDPVPDTVAMEPPTATSARNRLEHIMAIDSNPPNITTADRSTRRRPGRLVSIAGAAAALALVVGIGVALTGDGDDSPREAAPPLVLEIGANDTLGSCLAPTAELIRTMTPAFAGTVTAVEDETITLEVDTWYAGGDAETVELHAPAGLEALIGGIDFRTGEQYFITAAQGNVNYCGFSGPLSDPALAALVQEAFAS